VTVSGYWVLAFAFLLIPACAVAQTGATESVEWSLQGCRDFLAAGSDAQFKQGYCGGVVSSLMTGGADLPADYRFCVGERVTVQQAIRVVVLYLDRRPLLNREPFQPLAREALRQAWPCR
jgi:Rap1a immunity proteins